MQVKVGSGGGWSAVIASISSARSDGIACHTRFSIQLSSDSDNDNNDNNDGDIDIDNDDDIDDHKNVETLNTAEKHKMRRTKKPFEFSLCGCFYT